jgi:hypothetical protein
MKQRKHRHTGPYEPQTLTRAVTHIRLIEVNAGKLTALDDLAQVYLALCQQYVTLFCTDERPNKLRAPLFAAPLSERWQRVAIQQAAGIAQSWRTNRAQAYQDYADDLLDYHEQESEGILDAGAQEPAWREWHIPVLRQTCIQANVNVAVLEPAQDSTFDYWFTISTLEFRKQLLIPVKLAAYHREVLKGKTINTSVTLNKRGDGWWLTLSYDQVIPVHTAPSAPVVGVDVGIASATRSRVHNRFIRRGRRSEAYCSTSSTLERRSGEATSRCRSPLTTFLNHPIADRTVREHQCLLASERIRS